MRDIYMIIPNFIFFKIVINICLKQYIKYKYPYSINILICNMYYNTFLLFLLFTEIIYI